MTSNVGSDLPLEGVVPRRYIAREVETRIGRALLTGEILDGAVIRVEVENDRLVVRHENLPEETETTAA